MKRLILISILSMVFSVCFCQTKHLKSDTAITKEQTIAILKRVADRIEKDQPEAAIVLLNLISCMQINKSIKDISNRIHKGDRQAHSRI